MDLEKAIRSRRAVRAYAAKPVPEAQLRALIDLAVQAPSAMNRQPWTFCVIHDQALLTRISNEAKRHLLATPANGYPSALKQQLADPAFHIFYHAPVLVLICGANDDLWSRIDCALAAENLMLAATAAKLGSCWIGLAQAWLETPEGKAALGLAASCIPVAPIILGHPQTPPPQVPRKPPEIRVIA